MYFYIVVMFLFLLLPPLYVCVCACVCVCETEIRGNILREQPVTCLQQCKLSALTHSGTHTHTCIYRCTWSCKSHLLNDGLFGVGVRRGGGGERLKWGMEAEVWRWRQAGPSETDSLCAWGSVSECMCDYRQSGSLEVCVCVCVCVKGVS